MSGRRNSPIVLSNDENSLARSQPSHNVIVLSNDDSSSTSVSPTAIIRIGNKYQVTFLPLPIPNSRVHRNRNDKLISPNNVENQDRRNVSKLRKRVAEFISKYPRATEKAEYEAKRTGLSHFLKRVRRSNSKKAYEWKLMLYRGG